MPAGWNAKQKSDYLAGRIAAPASNVDGAGTLPPGTHVLGEAIGRFGRTPRLTHSPSTRALDDRGRFPAIRLPGFLALGWARPANLSVTIFDRWLVLEPCEHGDAKLDRGGRIRLGAVARAHLGVGFFDEVLALAVPRGGFLAVASPAVALVGAPAHIAELAQVPLPPTPTETAAVAVAGTTRSRSWNK